MSGTFLRRQGQTARGAQAWEGTWGVAATLGRVEEATNNCQRAAGEWGSARATITDGDAEPLLATPTEEIGFQDVFWPSDGLGFPSPEEFLFQIGQRRVKGADSGDPRPHRSRRAEKRHPSLGKHAV